MLLSLVLAAQLSLSPEIPIAAEAMRASGGPQSHPAVASAGHEFFAVWEHRLDIIGSRIDEGGAAIDRAGGITVQPTGFSDYDPSVVWNGETYVTAFGSGDVTRPYGIKGIEITRGGEVINERMLVTPRAVSGVDIAGNGSLYLLTWREGAYGPIRGLLVDSALNAVGEELVLDAGIPDHVDVAVASNGTNFLVAWQNRDGAFAQAVSADGIASPPVRISAAASSIDVASNGVSYVVFGSNELVAMTSAGAVTHRVALPVGSEGVLAWDGVHWVAAWIGGDRVMVALFDPTLGVVRAAERLVARESTQRSPALATSARGTLVLWSDAVPADPAGADILSAFLGEPVTTRLVSSGPAPQAPAGAAWSAETLGILWTEGEPFSQALRFGVVTENGTPLTADGIPLGNVDVDNGIAHSSSLASNGEAFAVAMARDQRIDVQMFSAEGRALWGPLAIGAGRVPRIASDGRDFFVIWNTLAGGVAGRAVRADGTLGELREVAGTSGAALVHAGGAYVAVTVVIRQHNRLFSDYTILSTTIGDEAAAPITIFSESNVYLGVFVRAASNGSEVFYAWTTSMAGLRTKLGNSGAIESHVKPSGVAYWHLLNLAWDGSSLVFALNAQGGVLLIRGSEQTLLDAARWSLVLAAASPRHSAAVYARTLIRIPGLPLLDVDRTFLRRLVTPVRRRAARP